MAASTPSPRRRKTPNSSHISVSYTHLRAHETNVDLGGQNVRVNALSAGPMKTLAGAAITGARHIYRYAETAAPLGRNPDINEVGRSGLYLVSDLSSGVTGEVHFVDGGFNTIATPPEDTE